MLDKMYTYLLYRSHPFVWMNVLTYSILFLIRMAEILFVMPVLPTIALRDVIVPIMMNDLLFFGLFALIITPVYLLIYRYSTKSAVVFHMTVITLLVFLSLGTSLYYSISLVPLSVDLFGYSFNDISETVAASGGVSADGIILFVLTTMLIAAIPFVSKRLPVPKFLTVIFYLLLLISVPLRLIFPEKPSSFTSELEYQFAINKSGYLAERTANLVIQKIFGKTSTSDMEYPFLRPFVPNDVLGPFLNTGEAPPNIVFIIVEGLGESFVDDGYYAGFLPFVDTLCAKSLYWNNFLSTSGRTFGVLPSLLGSLPYGEKGFMEMGPNMPNHETLISMLKENGYYTSYYYGGISSFDMQDVFLEYQKIDKLVDDNFFPPPYQKSAPNDGGFSWGYADKDLFTRSLEIIDEQYRTPRLDVYLTLSTHEPFIPPNQDMYQKRFEETVHRLPATNEKKSELRRYTDIFSSLLYADDALRYFFAKYEERPDYQNTIFIITGDHRLIPIPQETKIDRFRVPFIIYSPMLKKAQKFSSVSSHADVVPSLASYLRMNYRLKIPEQIHWLGSGIDTAAGFRNIHSLPIMRNKNELIDYLDGNYFYSEGRLFAVTDRLGLNEMENDSIQTVMAEKLRRFKSLNEYVCLNNKLYPYQKRVDLLADKVDYNAVYQSLNIGRLNSDAQFNRAQEFARDGKFTEARAICKKLLSISPNYHDVRTLLGRTYSWEHQYDNAREIFKDVIDRAPNYSDGYVALAQVEYWSSNPDTALRYIDTALIFDSINVDIIMLKARIMNSIRQDSAAAALIGRVLNLDPRNELALDLKKKIVRKEKE